MKRTYLGVYNAPQLKELNVRCEAGFAASVGIDGITSEDGVWDE